ncbi:MAG: hypothetical protein F4X98_06530 [Gammaproteobacteria bacterium]|nr:hypothetical protein [Gammaproteobacteria bacterium]
MGGNHVRPMATLVVALAGVLVGCGGGFDNPLPWQASPLTHELVGTWRPVEGGDTAVALVSQGPDGALSVELTYQEGVEATFETRKKKERATFLADLLAVDSLHVLQIRLDTYEEFDEHGKALRDSANGYLFRRVVHSPDSGLSIQKLRGSVLGRLAEAELADADIEIDVAAASQCVSGDFEAGLLLGWSRSMWQEIDGKMSDGAKAELIAALGGEDQTIADFERALAELDEKKTDPYKELAGMKACLARRLPGDALGHVFLMHSEAIFSGEVERYVRVQGPNATDPVTSP